MPREDSPYVAAIVETHGAIPSTVPANPDAEWYLNPHMSILFYNNEPTPRFKHRCDRWATGKGVVDCAPSLSPQHVVYPEARTIVPSLLCPDCLTHGNVTDNQWIPAQGD